MIAQQINTSDSISAKLKGVIFASGAQDRDVCVKVRVYEVYRVISLVYILQ